MQLNYHKPKPLWQSRTLRYSLIIFSSVSCVLLFLLASASSNTPLFERHYPLLLGLTAAVALAMAALVGILVWRLIKRFRSGIFGTRLMARLALSFALMGILPGLTIYLVSAQFIFRSIESWFDVRVDQALEAGLTLGHTAFDSLLADLNTKARVMALELSDASETQQLILLNRLRDQTGVEEALLFTSSGRILGAAGGVQQTSIAKIASKMPSQTLLRQARLTGSYAAIENADENDADHSERNLRMRIVVAIPANNISLAQWDGRYLQLLHAVSPTLAANALAVQEGARNYQEISLSRGGLQKIYRITLTLTLLLAVFAALAAAFLLSSWLAAPLLLLEQGTKAVAGGDFRPMQEMKTNDELGTLTQSFNMMMRQLDEARAIVTQNRMDLENAKTYLESILANLSAGVLVLDHDFHVVTVNQSALNILDLSLAMLLDQRLGTISHSLHGLINDFEKFETAIVRAFSQQQASQTSAFNHSWQIQIELPRCTNSDQATPALPLTLLARGSSCPVNSRQGYLVVFDDISDMISAQRSIAWGEVARRLAHEIKNPLTPIQLSAERLLMKLAGKLPAEEVRILERSVTTIVNQVTAMKNMVDDFREYAKPPPAVLSEIDLNLLIQEVMVLYEDNHEEDAIKLELADNLPMIIGDAIQLRQVIHNLVQNAQDATQEMDRSQATPTIRIATERVTIPQTEGLQQIMVRMKIMDNGGGFPSKILAQAFEPYVTTKPRGTGLGLAMVKKILDEHDARVEIRNTQEGACITILYTRVVAQQHMAHINN